MPIREELAHALFDIGAIKFGAFRLKLHETQPDAPLSPIYLNLRTPDNKGGPLTPRILELIGTVLANLIGSLGIDFNLIVGLPRAGDPIADAVHAALGRPDVRILRLVKSEGDGKRQITEIESGSFTPGDRAIVIDDLVTKAGTKREGISVLENPGIQIAAVIVLVDREQGGREELEKAGYAVHAAFMLTELLDMYVASLDITHSKRDEVLAYIAANRS